MSSVSVVHAVIKQLIQQISCDTPRARSTHVDDRLLELDVEPVVGRCDDGILRLLHILGGLAVQLHKRNLEPEHTDTHQQLSH